MKAETHAVASCVQSAGAPTATISNAAASKGLATTIAAGTTQITATSGAVTGKVTLTVTN
jgi:hypothetical protein